MIVRIENFVACVFLVIANLLTWYNVWEFTNSGKTLTVFHDTKETTLSKFDLAIGILSAPNNSAQRDAVRKTWLKEIELLANYQNLSNLKVKAWFIIGNDFCNIPPDYRIDPYRCEWLKLNYSAAAANPEFSSCEVIEKKLYPCSPSCLTPVFQGFSFQVNYPIVITKLGVLAEGLSPGGNVTIALLNGGSKEVLVKTSISSLQPGILVNGFHYRPVEKYVLPKGYEGILLIEGYLLNFVSVRIKWNTESGLITFRRIYKSSDDFNGLVFMEQLVVGPAFYASIIDLEKLKSFVDNEANAIEAWKNSLHSMKTALYQELDTWKDIILVNVTDIYRNLSQKILQFFTWLSSNYEFSYLLKTDDDCIVNLPAILHKLKSITLHNLTEKWWWSRFRTQWPVNFFGKWKDYEYPSTVYPRFPCGGAYVLSADLVHWIAHNAHVLYPFQGEDVSLGIWCAALNPVHIEDENWSCDSTCTPNSLNMAQLSIEELYNAWDAYQKCGNICHCD